MNIAKLTRISALALLAPAIAGCVDPMKVEGKDFNFDGGPHFYFAQAKSRDGLGQDVAQAGTVICATHMAAPDGSDQPTSSDTKCVASIRQSFDSGVVKSLGPAALNAAGFAGGMALIRPPVNNTSNNTNVSNQGSSAVGGSTNVTANAAGGQGGMGGSAKAEGGSAVAKGGDAKSYSDSHSSATQSQAQSQSQSQAQSQSQTATAPQTPPPSNHGGGDDHGHGEDNHGGYGNGGDNHGDDHGHGGSDH